MKRVTIAELAREAGVSVSTVNRVLSGRQVRADTVQHVLSVAEAVGFYGTATIRSHLKGDLPVKRLGLIVQQEGMPFHKELGTRFKEAGSAREDRRVVAHVEHIEDLDPVIVADTLRKLGRNCEAVAITSADHPLVNRAVDELAQEGIAVFTAVSDISSGRRAGYVGLDNRKFGRAAGWFADRLQRKGNEVAILMGTHRHVCQEQREMGFRSYLREHAADLTVLEAVTTHETDLGAYDATSDLLRRHPDLTAIYVTGGGIRGAIRALREAEGPTPHLISCELNDETRQALVEGTLSVALSHPMADLAEKLVSTMLHTIEDERADRRRAEVILPFATTTAESIF
ncbi:LacI family DNA-binding transcriptional regulator [Shinella sp. BYT-45]|uniref:LacI family DNA-binding transcriptional regulator n=1 Tax=Shinella sp. BYT-45 TaxID=3377377 RepID=UPI0039808DFB